MEDHVTRGSHLEGQIHCDVRKSEVTISKRDTVSAIINNFKKRGTYQAISMGVRPRLSLYVIRDRAYPWLNSLPLCWKRVAM